MPPKNDPKESNHYSCCEGLCVFFSALIVCLTFPISLFICLHTVMEYQRAVIFRFGKFR